MTHFQIGDAIWLIVLVLISLFFFLPVTNQIYVNFNLAQPYMMGFIKFAILGPMGELLATRLKAGFWKMPIGFFYKVIVWGLLGIAITFMFSFYSHGVSAMAEKGLLRSEDSWGNSLLQAFLTSALMNLTFGPVFMGAHRITDTTIEFLVQKQKVGKGAVIRAIDWADFINFVVLKTIPMWWIPVHTITFLLPLEYRVLVAAYLSIALGIILVYARKRKSETIGKQHI